MHKLVKQAKTKIKNYRKRNLSEEQRQQLDAIEVIVNYFEAKEAKGLALTKEDEAVLIALGSLFGFMPKDSSIT